MTFSFDQLLGLLKRPAKPQTRPARRLHARRFDGAGTGHRARDWLPQGPMNSELAAQKVRLDGRAKNLVYNVGYAAAGVQAWVTGAVGTGVMPRSQARRQEAGTLHRLWHSWGREADADGLCNVYGLQALALRQMIISGEAILLRLLLNGRLRYRLLDPAFLPMDLSRLSRNGNNIIQGVEFNAAGERVAYHLHKSHPAEGLGLPIDTTRVQAEDVIHCFRPLEAGQVRGLSWLTPVMAKLRQVEELEDAELMRKKIQALFAGFLTTPDYEDRDNVDEGDGSEEEELGIVDYMEPGTLYKLATGEEISFPNVPADGAQGTLALHIIRAIAAGLGVPAHLLHRDLSQANYSSLRADLVDFRRLVEEFQWNCLVPQLLQPLWRNFVMHHAMSGALPAADSERLVEDVEWRFPRWPWVDPLKDLQAEVLAIQHGLKSRAQVVAELGFDVEDQDMEITRDREREERLGLGFGSPALKMSQAAEGAADEEPSASAAPADNDKAS